jgi:RNA polymerase sigma-70 factor (ECF subfamily)
VIGNTYFNRLRGEKVLRKLLQEQGRPRVCTSKLVLQVAKERSTDAFGAIFQNYRTPIRGYLMRLGAGETLAEELTQEVMLKVWNSADRFDGVRASFKTWIFRLTRNLYFDHLRKNKMKKLESDQEPTHEPSTRIGPEVRYLQKEAFHGLKCAMAKLPAEQASVVTSVFFEGLTMEEIAMSQALPVGTVKSRLRLARRTLRTKLD